jgi:membrane-bound lytic murein transglycosylase D
MKPGDTLPQVATKFGLSVETLRTINGIGARAQVPSGHTLLVPAQTPSVDSAASLRTAVFTTVPSGRTFYHTVHRGDTLARVATRYGVTSQDLKRWNGLTQEQVRVGQQLRVTTDAAPVRTARHVGRGAHGTTTARGATKAAPPSVAGAPSHKMSGAGARPARTAASGSTARQAHGSVKRTGAAVAHGGPNGG